MAKTGRPKSEDSITHFVGVKLNNHDYDLVIEYCKKHNMTLSHMIRYGLQLQLQDEGEDLERLD
ncbi:hypothetical protein [Butyrivibrio sp. AE3004]|jgi:hypothetical protein|uniref:hypothetical protein n=1 Tax=Butyrivibrio sp. AE3004 TaxID=1506994 RepID=UPI0004946453|nr:hypothetical protein [Butyrivibrio sp. AE3004]